MSTAAFATLVQDKNQLERNPKKPSNFPRWSDFLLLLFNNALNCSKTMWLRVEKLQKTFSSPPVCFTSFVAYCLCMRYGERLFLRIHQKCHWRKLRETRAASSNSNGVNAMETKFPALTIIFTPLFYARCTREEFQVFFIPERKQSFGSSVELISSDDEGR
jgi:hypothetical protein